MKRSYYIKPHWTMAMAMVLAATFAFIAGPSFGCSPNFQFHLEVWEIEAPASAQDRVPCKLASSPWSSVPGGAVNLRCGDNLMTFEGSAQ